MYTHTMIIHIFYCMFVHFIGILKTELHIYIELDDL